MNEFIYCCLHFVEVELGPFLAVLGNQLVGERRVDGGACGRVADLSRTCRGRVQRVEQCGARELGADPSVELAWAEGSEKAQGGG